MYRQPGQMAIIAGTRRDKCTLIRQIFCISLKTVFLLCVGFGVLQCPGTELSGTAHRCLECPASGLCIRLHRLGHGKAFDPVELGTVPAPAGQAHRPAPPAGYPPSRRGGDPGRGLRPGWPGQCPSAGGAYVCTAMAQGAKHSEGAG